MTQFTLPEILNQHVVLLGIHIRTANTKILERSNVNVRAVQRIQKEEFNGDYKGMAAWKSHPDHSDKKRTPKFVEIQAIIDNYPIKTIKSMVRNMRMSEFLIKQAEHEDIHYFS